MIAMVVELKTNILKVKRGHWAWYEYKAFEEDGFVSGLDDDADDINGGGLKKYSWE